MKLEIDVSELNELARDFEAAREMLPDRMRAAMQASVDEVRNQVVPRTPVNTGALRGSIATQVRGSGTDIRGIVLSPLVYGLPVERGRQPGRPPPTDAIQAWVIRKGIAPAGDSRGVAYVIARAIGRRGTKGAKMFEQGLDAARPRLIGFWQQVTRDIADRLRK